MIKDVWVRLKGQTKPLLVEIDTNTLGNALITGTRRRQDGSAVHIELAKSEIASLEYQE